MATIIGVVADLRIVMELEAYSTIAIWITAILPELDWPAGAIALRWMIAAELV